MSRRGSIFTGRRGISTLRSARPSGAWLPSDITGVAEWWRADLGTDATEVGSWEGQIAGETLTQATASAKPNTTTRDGQTALFFDDGDRLTGAFSTIGLIAQPLSCFVVWEISDETDVSQWVIDGDNGANRLLAGKSSTDRFFMGSTLAASSHTTGMVAWHVFGNGASSSIFVNDFTAAKVTGNAGSGGVDGFNVGSDYLGGSTITGYVWEIILIDQEITASDLSSLGAYLDARYPSLSLTY